MALSGDQISPFVAPSRDPDSTVRPELGLGCVTFGREIDAPASFAMLDHALACGIKFLDTAAAYGAGASETIVGQWLAQRGTRERVTISTKILPPFTSDEIEAAVDASLQRLGLSSIDVLFLHRWDETLNQPSAWRALDRLVRDGRVRRLGASNFSVLQLEDALRLQERLGFARLSMLQNIHNFAVRGIDQPVRDLCARTGVRIVTYSPLGAGFLTGKHEQQVQPGSRFDLVPGHQQVYFTAQARERLALLRQTAEREGRSTVQLALAWALQQPHVGTVLIGGRTSAHIDQAFDARTLDVSFLR